MPTRALFFRQRSRCPFVPSTNRWCSVSWLPVQFRGGRAKRQWNAAITTAADALLIGSMRLASQLAWNEPVVSWRPPQCVSRGPEALSYQLFTTSNWTFCGACLSNLQYMLLWRQHLCSYLRLQITPCIISLHLCRLFLRSCLTPPKDFTFSATANKCIIEKHLGSS